MIGCKEWNRQAYARRKGQAIAAPELPDEWTPAAVAMEREFQHRREAELKEALRKSRLKKHKIFAVTLQGGSVKP
jgi:hypothetical protein